MTCEYTIHYLNPSSDASLSHLHQSENVHRRIMFIEKHFAIHNESVVISLHELTSFVRIRDEKLVVMTR